MKSKHKDLIISIAAFIIASASALFILNWEKHSLGIENLGVFLFKLLPFISAVIFLAFFPLDKFPVVIKILLGITAFGIIFCYFIGNIIIFFFTKASYETLYLHLQFMTPFILLVITASFRAGGLPRKGTLVLGCSSLLFMLSGIEDLTTMYLLSRKVPEFQIPDVWENVHHMTVFAGRPLSKTEAFVFISIHFILIGVILFLSYSPFSPLKKIKRLKHEK